MLLNKECMRAAGAHNVCCVLCNTHPTPPQAAVDRLQAKMDQMGPLATDHRAVQVGAFVCVGKVDTSGVPGHNAGVHSYWKYVVA